MRPMHLSVEEVRSRLAYDPSTGHVVWKINVCNIKAGRRAGVQRNDGYRLIGLDRRSYYEHHIAYFLMTGIWPVGEIDHKDRDPSNNKWGNLRPATRAENSKNLTPRDRVLPRGVYQAKANRYRAQCQSNGDQVHLGTYDTIEEAKQAYDTYAKQHFGEFFNGHEIVARDVGCGRADR